MPKVRVTITIDESVLEKVDSARGSTSRSEYIERVLAEHLGLRSAHPTPTGMAADGALEILKEMLGELREIRRLLSAGGIAAKGLEEEPAGEALPEAGESLALPSFALDNPWLGVLRKRGKSNAFNVG